MPIYITENGGNPFEIGYQWPNTRKVCYVYNVDRVVESLHFFYCDFSILVKRRGNRTWIHFIFRDPANSVLRNKRHNMFNRKTIISK